MLVPEIRASIPYYYIWIVYTRKTRDVLCDVCFMDNLFFVSTAVWVNRSEMTQNLLSARVMFFCQTRQIWPDNVLFLIYPRTHIKILYILYVIRMHHTTKNCAYARNHIHIICQPNKHLIHINLVGNDTGCEPIYLPISLIVPYAH